MLSFATVKWLVEITLQSGIAIALFKWIFDRRKKQKEDIENSAKARRNGFWESYNDLRKEYFKFLELCLSKPHLGVAATQEEVESTRLSEVDRSARSLLYEMLFGIFERAFLTLRAKAHPDEQLREEIEKKIWPGWQGYIEFYLGRRTCLEEWKKYEGTEEYPWGYHRDFEDYMNNLARKHRPEAQISYQPEQDHRALLPSNSISESSPAK